ncbi:hypothetical protein [Duganella sp. CY15W]|uniref:hypothetical protein n=1 Tax=Duganella sp. CY15W TaxID=2692172 RepID=UPI00136A1A7F|nr:hypothetical protein [Duganella sp. CY15W]
MNMNVEQSDATLFSFKARDGVAMFWIFFIVFIPGGATLGPPFMSVDAFLICTAAYAVLAYGLDCKITVTSDRVRFVRRLYWIPFYARSGRVITSISYDSDWDDEESASGVVVEIDGRETHIGAGKRKAELYMGLFRNSETYRSMQAEQGFKPTPDGAT